MVGRTRSRYHDGKVGS